MPIKDQAKWKRLHDIYLTLSPQGQQYRIVMNYWLSQDTLTKICEDILEKGLILAGTIPASQLMSESAEENAQEYEDIITGAEIWASIRKNSEN